MGTPTALTLPDALPYPITITNLLARPGDTLARGAALCDYSFEYTYPAHARTPSASSSSPKSPGRETEKRYGRWECPIDGVLDKWLIRKGVTIRSVEQARSEPAAMLLYVLAPITCLFAPGSPHRRRVLYNMIARTARIVHKYTACVLSVAKI